MLLVKENISKYIKTEKVSPSNLIRWFTISSKITCLNENIHCGVVYIPPIIDQILFTVVSMYF